MEAYTDNWNHRESLATWMIKEADTVAISGHMNPDEDSFGSQLATYYILMDNFPEKEVVLLVDGNALPLYDRYKSIFKYDSKDNALLAREEYDCIIKTGSCFDLFIGVDCSSTQRLPEFADKIALLSKNQLYFDHHYSPEDDKKFCVLNDDNAASCTQVIHRFFKGRQFSIPNKAYAPLYLGLLGDTGNFIHSNTDAHVFKLAKEFSGRMDFTPYEISRMVRSRTLEEMRSIADVYNSMDIRCWGSFVIYRHYEYDDIAKGFSSTNNPIDVLTQLKDYEIALTAVRDSLGTYRVSLRSSGYFRVDTYADRYGGGGHTSAAGCTCTNKELDDLIYDIENDIINEFELNELSEGDKVGST